MILCYMINSLLFLLFWAIGKIELKYKNAGEFSLDATAVRTNFASNGTYSSKQYLVVHTKERDRTDSNTQPRLLERNGGRFVPRNGSVQAKK